MLEAGSIGVPAITYRGHPDDCGVLGADTRGVDEHLVSARDPDGFATALDALIVDGDGRRLLGERTERAIRETHTGDGWRRGRGGALRVRARAAPPPAPTGPVARETGRLDVLVDLVMDQTGFAHGVPGATRDHLALLPTRERAAAWSRLTRAGTRPPHGHVVPEWLLARLWRYRRAPRGVAGRRASGAQRRHAQWRGLA